MDVGNSSKNYTKEHPTMEESLRGVLNNAE